MFDDKSYETYAEGAMHRLYAIRKSGDVTILCGDEKFKLHRCIVYSHPGVGRLGLLLDRASKRFYNPTGGVVAVLRTDDFSPEIVERFIQFLYLGDYDEQLDGSHRENDAYRGLNLKEIDFISLHADMYAIGIGYGMENLLDTVFGTITRLLEGDQLPDARRLALASRTIYKAASDRNMWTETVIYMSFFKGWMDTDTGKDLLEEFPQIAREVLKVVKDIKDGKMGHTYRRSE